MTKLNHKRMGYIGGSDTYRIMKGDWLSLWQEKTGRALPADLSDVLPVQMGITTEALNLAWLEQETGYLVTPNKERFTANIGGVPVQYEPDGFVADDANSLAECKHTNDRNSLDEVLETYMPQIQTYIHAHDYDGLHLSVFFGNSRWESCYVERHTNWFRAMWQHVKDFWAYVEKDEEPPHTVPEVKHTIAGISIDHMVARDASKDNQFVSFAHDYVKNVTAAKTFEDAKKTLKGMVEANEREVWCDTPEFRLTIKRAKNRSLRFNLTEKTDA